MTDRVSLNRQQPGQLPCALTGPSQRGHGIAPSVGVDQSLQGLDQLRVMLDQRLASATGVPYSLNEEGALRKSLDGPIDGRTSESGNPGDQGNTSPAQSLAIKGGDQVLLSHIEVRKQQRILLLEFCGLTHSGIIPWLLRFVTIIFLRPLTVLGCQGHGL